MLDILLTFVWTVVFFVGVVLVCNYIGRWLDKRLGNKTSYRVTYEYMMFVLTKDHTAGGTFKFESWEKLKALGVDGWEIAETLEHDYDGVHFILKRETFHQS